MELHTLTLVAHSYPLLLWLMSARLSQLLLKKTTAWWPNCLAMMGSAAVEYKYPGSGAVKTRTQLIAYPSVCSFV